MSSVPGAGLPLAALLMVLAAGCSSRYPVLVKVAADVDAPKAVDIVWVLTESDSVVSDEILAYKKKGITEYFRTGRATLSPGYFRFYRFLLEGEKESPLQESGPLEVRSDPGSTRPKLYGPYAQKIPAGAVKGFLFVEYGKGAETTGLPLMVYPKLPTYPGYEEVAPGGISIEVGREKCRVIPFEKEEPTVIQEARRQEEVRGAERRRAATGEK